MFVRVALVSYSSSAFVRFNFLSSTSVSAVQQLILADNWQAGGTATASALNLVRSSLLTSAAGFRGGKAVVIVVTDGNTQESMSSLTSAVSALHAVAEVFAVGVGQEISATQIQLIASEPKAQHAFSTTLDGLASQSIIDQILDLSSCVYLPIDLVFILESSSSVSAQTWASLKQAVVNIINSLPVSSLEVRFVASALLIVS
jgi:hypothetical protein